MKKGGQHHDPAARRKKNTTPIGTCEGDKKKKTTKFPRPKTHRSAAQILTVEETCQRPRGGKSLPFRPPSNPHSKRSTTILLRNICPQQVDHDCQRRGGKEAKNVIPHQEPSFHALLVGSADHRHARSVSPAEADGKRQIPISALTTSTSSPLSGHQAPPGHPADRDQIEHISQSHPQSYLPPIASIGCRDGELSHL